MLYSMSKTYVANGKELELLDRNRISSLHNCEKGRREFLVKSFAHLESHRYRAVM